jgi:hypothetical protein
MEDEYQMPKRKPNMSKALILEFKKKVLYKKHEQLLYLGDVKGLESPAYMPRPPVKKNKLNTDLNTSVEKDGHNPTDPDAQDTKKKTLQDLSRIDAEYAEEMDRFYKHIEKLLIECDGNFVSRYSLMLDKETVDFAAIDSYLDTLFKLAWPELFIAIKRKIATKRGIFEQAQILRRPKAFKIENITSSSKHGYWKGVDTQRRVLVSSWSQKNMIKNTQFPQREMNITNSQRTKRPEIYGKTYLSCSGLNDSKSTAALMTAEDGFETFSNAENRHNLTMQDFHRKPKTAGNFQQGYSTF